MAGNRLMTGLMTRHGLKLGASRFVAGVTLQDAVETARKLNEQGLAVTLDLLGEGVTTREDARTMAEGCAAILEAIHRERLDANLSVKPTQLGLAIGAEAAMENLTQLQDIAKRTGNFIRIDMEASDTVDATLDVVKRLYAREPNVGTVIQAYLYRSPKDLQELAELGMNVRLVKGAYLEPPSVAYPKKADTDEAFKRLIAQHLSAGCYTAVATHDEAIIAFTKRFVEEHAIPRHQFEFQMLYGIRTELQRQLAGEGYRTRVYVPFGTYWYPYFVRRLAERPANVWFVLANLMKP
nr:proline dehydrogenase family protein [Symbiobacterium terraclitae]